MTLNSPSLLADPHRRTGRSIALLGLAAVLLATACGAPSASDLPARPEDPSVAANPANSERVETVSAPVEPAPVIATADDWRIARHKVRWAASEWAAGTDGPNALDYGELVAAIGASFLGTAYVPHTLEVDGPERLVVDLTGLDCVTFIETVLTLAHLARTDPAAAADAQGFENLYARTLIDMRYRSGVLDGYPSRLHYFSDWIADNEAMGLVTNLTQSLGGRLDPEPVDFMSTHPDAYPQLADAAALAAIVAVESRLNSTPRHFIPEGEIATRASGIRTGDIIAATSSVAGLDVAHTGLAVWKDGELHLLHAPLVGKNVQLSASPIADRILRFSGQDGILVARPVDPGL